MREHNDENSVPTKVNDESNGRRDFFKKIFMLAGASVAVQLLARSKAFAALKSYKDPQCKGPAASIGYVNNLAVALKQKKIHKTAMTVGGKTWKPLEQHCANCMFFGKNQGKTVPSCQLMPGCAVSPGGSCNSWTAKA